jgi:hypothetical protein
MSKVGAGDKKVSVTTVDVAAERNPAPTFLIIDVEGFAAEVMRGATRALASGPPVVCEIHNPAEHEGVSDQLAAAGYIIRRIDNDGRKYPFRILASK